MLKFFVHTHTHTEAAKFFNTHKKFKYSALYAQQTNNNPFYICIVSLSLIHRSRTTTIDNATRKKINLFELKSLFFSLFLTRRKKKKQETREIVTRKTKSLEKKSERERMLFFF
jgi:hypothetical protein